MGKGKNINTDILVKVCNALKCDFADIMEIVNYDDKIEMVRGKKDDWFGSSIYKEKDCWLYGKSIWLGKKSNILDPCYGEGVFLESLVENQNGYIITGIELDKKLFLNSQERFKRSCTLKNIDFLIYDSNNKYDGIIMNPPYIRNEKIDDLSGFGITKNIYQRIQYLGTFQVLQIYIYILYVRQLICLKRVDN